MKKLIAVFVLAMFVLPTFLNADNSKKSTPEKMLENIQWLGQAAIKITAEDKIIYIDPYRIKKSDKADFILITHKHSDHLSTEDISKISADKSVLIAPQTCKDDVKDIEVKQKIYLEPGKDTKIDDIKIEAVPAYNVVKTNFHPKLNKMDECYLSMDFLNTFVMQSQQSLIVILGHLPKVESRDGQTYR